MDSVGLVRFKQDIGEALKEGLELIGGFGDIKSPVLVKPNICTISDNTGYSVTRVEVVEALVHIILEVNGNPQIRIVESDSQSKTTGDAFEKFGYTRLAGKMQSEGFDVSLVNLSQSHLESRAFEGDYFRNPDLPDLIARPGYFISVAAAKTHYLTSITGVLKNLFGVLPRKDQSFYHSRIDDVIVDLGRLIRPDLSIVDARFGIEGWNGPTTRQLDAFILGHEPVSVDATLARILGLEPREIRHLTESAKHELGTLDPEIVGSTIESIAVTSESC
ncbi:MAG: DUF362 domain-containing protein [Promethearchaeota archaeon]